MEVTLTQAELASWLYVSARLLGWAWIDPLLSRLSWSVRLLVAGSLAWVWVPAIPAGQSSVFTPDGLVSLTFAFLTGAVMGFVPRLLVAVSEAALSLVGLTASLGLAQVQAEQKGGLDSVLRSLAWWLALLAFFSANGQLLVIQAFNASFAAVPAGGLIGAASAYELVQAGGMLLATALQLALPLLIMVLLAHLAFSILSRTLPGVDGFSVGLTLGAFTLMASLTMAVPMLISGLGGSFNRLIPQLLP